MSEKTRAELKEQIKIMNHNYQVIKEMHERGYQYSVGEVKRLQDELERTREALEQSETCCTEWEKQALDYKAENIALSGDLDRTRKALDVAKEGLKEIQDKGEYVNPIELAESCLDEITALEQKDK